MNYVIHLVIVIDGIEDNNEINLIEKEISSIFGSSESYKYENYPKFDNSYKLSFTFIDNVATNIMEYCIIKSDLICSPWLVYYLPDENKMDLIYNRDHNSQFGKDIFYKIRWANLFYLKV